MLLLLLTLVIPILFGIIAILAFNLLPEKISAVLTGTIFGLAFFTTITYIAGMLAALNAVLLITLLVLAAAAATAMAYICDIREKWAALKLDKTALIALVLLFGLFGIIAPKLLIEKDTGLYTGIINAYGDVAWHMANITAFAEGQSVPPENPIMAGERLTYPFMSNFFSAILMTAGASYTQSVNLPAFLFIPVLLMLFYCLARDTASGNKTAAIIALLLFLFGGATFGWLRFGADLQASGLSPAEFLVNLPTRDYSGVGSDSDGFHFLNPVTSLLLPQRPFLFGMPLAFAILLLLLPRKDKKEVEYIAAGVLSGITPLFHAHTILALIPPILALLAISPGRKWFMYFLITGVIGIPQVLYYLTGDSEAGSFLRFEPGWMSSDRNFILYWFMNTGLLLPTAIIGCLLPAPKTLKALAIAGFTLFAAGNLWLFAPWAWDNFKILVFWLLWSLPLIGWMTARLLQAKFPVYVHLLVSVFIGLHILSAGLDIWKLTLPTSESWIEWDNHALQIAATIKELTSPHESILTAPVHNSVPAISGRATYLGYPAHIWSHGGNPNTREQAIQPFYHGQLDQLPDMTPNYVLIGPVEKSRYPNLVIRDHWQLVAETPGYVLYRIR